MLVIFILTCPALKHECHSKSTYWLKNVLQKPHEEFQGSGITELHAKLDEDILLDFCHPLQKK
jgi:hypothetical protein